jgi:DNA (cytosine-5)-methyltransferase 1
LGRRGVSEAAQGTFIDLFSGAGGLSLGLTQARWRCLLAVDHWRDAVGTYAHNFLDHPAIEGDISDYRGLKLRELLPDRPEWVVGGPPCQGFSTVGKRERGDSRNSLMGQFLRIVRELEPDGFVVENVLGLRDMRFHGEIKAAFEEAGYIVVPTIFTSADYGVPQLRRRIVFVGHRTRGYFLPPAPTRLPTEFTTVWEAIGDLPPLAPGQTRYHYESEPETTYQVTMRVGSAALQGHTASSHPPHLVQAISHIPDGGNRRSIPDHLQPKSGFHNSYSRLASFAPAVAVTSNMGKPSATRCIHPFQHRGLTAREGARLQSFPDRFHFFGGVVSQRLQVANAVPPMLAEQIGRALADPCCWADSPGDMLPSQMAGLREEEERSCRSLRSTTI